MPACTASLAVCTAPTIDWTRVPSAAAWLAALALVTSPNRCTVAEGENRWATPTTEAHEKRARSDPVLARPRPRADALGGRAEAHPDEPVGSVGGRGRRPGLVHRVAVVRRHHDRVGGAGPLDHQGDRDTGVVPDRRDQRVVVTPHLPTVGAHDHVPGTEPGDLAPARDGRRRGSPPGRHLVVVGQPRRR